MKKILLISAFAPHVSGGIGTWTKNYVESNWARKNQVTFFNLFIEKKCKISAFFQTMKRIMKLKKIIKTTRFDAVHINFGGSKFGLIRDVYIALYAIKNHIRTILECHCDANDYYNNFNSIEFLKKSNKKGCIFLVLNQSSFVFFESKIKVTKKHLFLVNNFCNNPKKIVSINKSVNNVIFVGNVIKQKGVELIFKLAKEFSNINFLFVGPNSKQIKKPSLNNVIFVGRIERNKILDYMLESDLMLLPSFSEGLPIAVIEAMSVGLPIIASNVGDIPTVLDNTGAGVFECGNYQEFFKLFVSMITDFRKRQIISKSEIDKFLTNYETEIVLEQISKIYFDF